MIRIGLCLTLVLAIVLPIERAAAKGDGGETTRFGTVDIGEEDGLSIVFRLNGKVTRPRIQGNSALRIQQSAISLGETDYIILESSGGTGQYSCPSSYAIVALSRDGIKPTNFLAIAQRISRRRSRMARSSSACRKFVAPPRKLMSTTTGR